MTKPVFSPWVRKSTRRGRPRNPPGTPSKVGARFLGLLKDGKPHSRQELHGLLADDLAPIKAIRKHITDLRKIVTLEGRLILCTIHNRKVHYQLVVDLQRHQEMITLARDETALLKEELDRLKTSPQKKPRKASTK